MGLGSRFVPASQVMPESPLLFSSRLPFCDFRFQPQPTGREVDDTKLIGTNALWPCSGRRRAAPRCLDFQLFEQNRRNKARMFMKTKEEVKKLSTHNGKKPLTRLATLATLNPCDTGFGSRLCSALAEAGTKSAGRHRLVRTNSISPLPSVKASKNELKTNSFLSRKCAKRTPIQGRLGYGGRPGTLVPPVVLRCGGTRDSSPS